MAENKPPPRPLGAPFAAPTSEMAEQLKVQRLAGEVRGLFYGESMLEIEEDGRAVRGLEVLRTEEREKNWEARKLALEKEIARRDCEGIRGRLFRLKRELGQCVMVLR